MIIYLYDYLELMMLLIFVSMARVYFLYHMVVFDLFSYFLLLMTYKNLLLMNLIFILHSHVNIIPLYLVLILNLFVIRDLYLLLYLIILSLDYNILIISIYVESLIIYLFLDFVLFLLLMIIFVENFTAALLYLYLILFIFHHLIESVYIFFNSVFSLNLNNFPFFQIFKYNWLFYIYIIPFIYTS